MNKLLLTTQMPLQK